MPTRRAFLCVLPLAVAVPFVAEAQQAAKVWRVGFLSIGTPPAAGATSLVGY